MIINILLNTFLIFVILLLQHFIFFLFLKEKSKSQLQEQFISIVGASIFIGVLFSLVSEIYQQFNYIFIFFILTSSIISSYWFIINPLKYLLFSKKYNRDFELEREINSEGNNYKVYFTSQISNNAFATGIIPFYKIILIGNNLKENLSKSELKAVIYHEIGHHENKHLLKLFFINVVLQTLCCLMFFEVNKIHFNFVLSEPLLVALAGSFMGLIFVYIPGKISYQFEYQADNYSAKKHNKIAIKEALIKLDEMSNGKLTKGNINHPNLEKRLKNIEKQKNLSNC